METLLITRKTKRAGRARGDSDAETHLGALFCLAAPLSYLSPSPSCLLIFTWGYLFVAPAAASSARLALFSGVFFRWGLQKFRLVFFFLVFYCCVVKILVVVVVPQFSCSLNNFSAWKFSPLQAPSTPHSPRSLCSSCRCPGRKRRRRRRGRWKVFIESCNLNLLGFTF